jgi:hypothetical protein
LVWMCSSRHCCQCCHGERGAGETAGVRAREALGKGRSPALRCRRLLGVHVVPACCACVAVGAVLVRGM